MSDAEVAVRHIVDAIDQLGLVSVSGDEAVREWRSAEVEWVTANSSSIPENVQVAYIMLLTELLAADAGGDAMDEAVATVRNARSVFADLLPPD